MAKQKFNKNSLSLLLIVLKDYLKKHKVGFIFAFICILLNSVGTIMAPLMLKDITNIITENAGLGAEKIAAAKSAIGQDLIVLICSYVIALIGGFTYGQIMAVTGQTYMFELRCKVFTHMQDLPIKYFDTHDKGDIMSVYTNDIDTIRQFIIQSLPSLLICFFQFISIVVIMITSSLYLFLIVICGAIVMLFSAKHIGGTSSKNFIQMQKNIGTHEGYIEEMMNGLKVVKSFCHEEESKKDFDKINNSLCAVSTKANRYANILMPVMGNIGNFLYVLVALIGTILYVTNTPNLTLTGLNQIQIGVIVSFLPMVKQFTNAVAEMSNQINSIAMAVGGSARIYAIMQEPKEVDDGYVKLCRGKKDADGNIVECDKNEATLWAWKYPHQDGQISYVELKGDVRMFDVDFGYDPNKIVLHDVSLYAEPGQKVAFVGATGAGKTTITNLLNRFYDIADGKIRYDGININKISKKDLRQSLAMVLQDTNLFTGTILDNIRYGRLDATDEECIEAAKLANADSFITRLPNGYNTMLKSDGANLSQGQRQLLSIARAAVSGAPAMILDEATSSIDTRTESLVTAAMDNLMKGRTTFVIAHRLSTIRNADVIMVLDHGRIIERGTHDQLLAKKGMYYQLYTGAFELE